MNEQTIDSLWEVVAECDTLVVGTHLDVHVVALEFVVIILTCAIALLEHQLHLVVVISNCVALAISRSPSLVYGCAFYICEL